MSRKPEIFLAAYATILAGLFTGVLIGLLPRFPAHPLPAVVLVSLVGCLWFMTWIAWGIARDRPH